MANANIKEKVDPEPLFPFVYLPDLVQIKILRDYVPFSTKVTVLCNMVEFSSLLEKDSPCWYYSYDTFLDLLPMLSALVPGLYVKPDKVLPDHGYYVSMDRENHVVFTLCSILPPLPEIRWHSPTPMITNQYEKSVYDFKNLIVYFLNHYVLAKHLNIQAYVKDDYTFIVNLPEKKLIGNNKIVFEIYPSGNCSILLSSRVGNRTKTGFAAVHLKPHTMTYVCNDKIDFLQARSLESLVLDQNNELLDYQRVCRFSFQLSKNPTVTMLEENFNKYAFMLNTYKTPCPLQWLELAP